MFNPVRIVSENDFDPHSGKYALEIFVSFENFHLLLTPKDSRTMSSNKLANLKLGSRNKSEEE